MLYNLYSQFFVKLFIVDSCKGWEQDELNNNHNWKFILHSFSTLLFFKWPLNLSLFLFRNWFLAKICGNFFQSYSQLTTLTTRIVTITLQRIVINSLSLLTSSFLHPSFRRKSHVYHIPQFPAQPRPLNTNYIIFSNANVLIMVTFHVSIDVPPHCTINWTTSL